MCSYFVVASLHKTNSLKIQHFLNSDTEIQADDNSHTFLSLMAVSSI